VKKPASLPNKLFFKIGEAADIIGVKPHVLRYWESEFRALRPMKTRGAHRVYRRQDVELALRIRTLIQEQGFTIAGAKKQLKDPNEPIQAHDRVFEDDKAFLMSVRQDLLDLLEELVQTRRQQAATAITTASLFVSAAVVSSAPAIL